MAIENFGVGVAVSLNLAGFDKLQQIVGDLEKLQGIATSTAESLSKIGQAYRNSLSGVSAARAVSGLEQLERQARRVRQELSTPIQQRINNLTGVGGSGTSARTSAGVFASVIGQERRDAEIERQAMRERIALARAKRDIQRQIDRRAGSDFSTAYASAKYEDTERSRRAFVAAMGATDYHAAMELHGTAQQEMKTELKARASAEKKAAQEARELAKTQAEFRDRMSSMLLGGLGIGALFEAGQLVHRAVHAITDLSQKEGQMRLAGFTEREITQRKNQAFAMNIPGADIAEKMQMFERLTPIIGAQNVTPKLVKDLGIATTAVMTAKNIQDRMEAQTLLLRYVQSRGSINEKNLLASTQDIMLSSPDVSLEKVVEASQQGQTFHRAYKINQHPQYRALELAVNERFGGRGGKYTNALISELMANVNPTSHSLLSSIMLRQGRLDTSHITNYPVLDSRGHIKLGTVGPSIRGISNPNDIVGIIHVATQAIRQQFESVYHRAPNERELTQYTAQVMKGKTEVPRLMAVIQSQDFQREYDTILERQKLLGKSFEEIEKKEHTFTNGLASLNAAFGEVAQAIEVNGLTEWIYSLANALHATAGFLNSHKLLTQIAVDLGTVVAGFVGLAAILSVLRKTLTALGITSLIPGAKPGGIPETPAKVGALSEAAPLAEGTLLGSIISGGKGLFSGLVRRGFVAAAIGEVTKDLLNSILPGDSEIKSQVKNAVTAAEVGFSAGGVEGAIAAPLISYLLGKSTESAAIPVEAVKAGLFPAYGHLGMYQDTEGNLYTEDQVKQYAAAKQAALQPETSDLGAITGGMGIGHRDIATSASSFQSPHPMGPHFAGPLVRHIPTNLLYGPTQRMPMLRRTPQSIEEYSQANQRLGGPALLPHREPESGALDLRHLTPQTISANTLIVGGQIIGAHGAASVSGVHGGHPSLRTPVHPVSPAKIQSDIGAIQKGMGIVTPNGVPDTSSHQAFLKSIMPMAIAESKKTGIDPRIIAAQAALESGYGKHAPNNNYFGIKGAGGTFNTTEYINGKPVTIPQSFAGYKSPQQSFDAYADFINKNHRYQAVKNAKGLDAQIAALGMSGYATDPAYANKIQQIARSMAPDMVANAESLAQPGTGKTSDTVAPTHQLQITIHNHTMLDGEPIAESMAHHFIGGGPTTSAGPSLYDSKMMPMAPGTTVIGRH